MIIRARSRQQCVICLGVIEIGSIIKVAAPDAIAIGHKVWCHEPCADSWLILTKGTPLFSDGWEELQASQKCASCSVLMMPRWVAHRVVNIQFLRYDRVCWNCWQHRGAARAARSEEESWMTG